MTDSISSPPPSPPIPAGYSTDASQIPVIETPRLRLRAFTLGDLPAASALWRDSKVVRYIGNTPRTQAEVWTAMARSFGHWALLGYGYWAIADRATNHYLGEIGFLEGLRDAQPSLVGTPEAGWALATSCWGKGYASEALSAMCDWADQALGVPQTVCIIDPGHHASQRVAEKNGYRLQQRGILKEDPVLILQRPRRLTDEHSET